MTQYSQRDIRWRWNRLGTSYQTIGSYGCAITALGNLVDRNPAEVNNILKANGAFLYGNLVIWDKACRALGLEWGGLVSAPKHYPSIMKVSAPNFPMHFVVNLGNGQVLDSWDGKIKYNPYKLVQHYDIYVKSPVAPSPVGGQGGTFTVRATGGLNIRSAPSTTAAKTGKLKDGGKYIFTNVVISDSVNGNSNWLRLPDNTYVSGYYCRY